MEVILNYDINDYKEKTELTSSKLVTTLIASLRNFDDLQRIEQNRQSLELVAASSVEMHSQKDKDKFGEFMISSLDSILKKFDPQCRPSLFHGYFTQGGEQVRILNGSGNFGTQQEDLKPGDFLNDDLLAELSEPGDENSIFYREGSALLHFHSIGGNERIVFIEDVPVLNTIQKSILLTFANHITTVFNNIELMEEQLQKENEIRKSLDEKLILVKEIHHRVKNNLQIISSLLHMQSINVEDPKLLDVLKESENRVQSMSLVHEKLYQSDLMATIDFNEYITSLAERLIHTYSVSSEIGLKIETDPLMLSINTAIPCGLIVNEILTNSIKYAFPGDRQGTISIFMKVDGNVISLTISDDGVGLPEDFDPSKTKSLGTKLIRVLSDQIDGDLQINRDRGTSYTLNFSESAQRES
nr:histidine kinase dimerization/phosphoacceptor domain -containing protein [Spirochaeta isovalerica]